jgi:hypothetical protein
MVFSNLKTWRVSTSRGALSQMLRNPAHCQIRIPSELACSKQRIKLIPLKVISFRFLTVEGFLVHDDITYALL